MSDGDLQRMIAAWLDGRITADQSQQLQQRLRESSTAREEFREFARLDAGIREVADVSRSHGEPNVSIHRGQSKTLAKPLWALALSIAVALLVAIGLLIRFNEDSGIATITGVAGSVEWISTSGRHPGDLAVGKRLTGGFIESRSTDSWVKFQFDDGSEITLTGRSSAMVSQGARKEISLRDGRLRATVHPQPTGQAMLVRTPTAELKVLGTQFNVESRALATTLAVHEGEVSVRRLTGGREVAVPARHRAVVSIEGQNEIPVVARMETVLNWRSELSKDAIYGRWGSGFEVARNKLPQQIARVELTEKEAAEAFRSVIGRLEEDGYLFAMPSMNRASAVATAGVSLARSTKIVVVSAQSKLRFEGRVESPAEVIFGIDTYDRDGGFDGVFWVARWIDVSDGDGSFTMEIPVGEFQSIHHQSASPAGHELTEIWCRTEARDAKLVVSNFELLE